MNTSATLARPRRRDQLADLIAAGDLSGYVPGAPAARLIDGPGIDARACAEATCQDCGRVGLDYRPFTSIADRRYRAFATCLTCGSAEEI